MTQRKTRKYLALHHRYRNWRGGSRLDWLLLRHRVNWLPWGLR